MLLLTRRPGEKIRIGEDITVMVGDIRGNQVRILIGAPDDLLILREELLEQQPLEEAS